MSVVLSLGRSSRPYLVNLLPCLTRITKRQEETVQETLAAATPKIMAALGHFANDGEVKVTFSLHSHLCSLKVEVMKALFVCFTSCC